MGPSQNEANEGEPCKLTSFKPDVDPLLSGALIALVSAAAGLLGNFFLQRSADKRRWEREDEIRRQGWEREDRIRFQSERQALYRDYLVGVRQALETGGEGFDAARMAPLSHQIELIGSSEVTNAAEDILMHGQQAKIAAERFHNNQWPGSKAEEAMLRLEESERRFINAAKAELGTQPGTDSHEGDER